MYIVTLFICIIQLTNLCKGKMKTLKTKIVFQYLFNNIFLLSL